MERLYSADTMARLSTVLKDISASHYFNADNSRQLLRVAVQACNCLEIRAFVFLRSQCMHAASYICINAIGDVEVRQQIENLNAQAPACASCQNHLDVPEKPRNS